MAERAAAMSWYDKKVVAGRSKSLTTGNTRCGVAAVHEVLGSPAQLTLQLAKDEYPLCYGFRLSSCPLMLKCLIWHHFTSMAR